MCTVHWQNVCAGVADLGSPALGRNASCLAPVGRREVIGGRIVVRQHFSLTFVLLQFTVPRYVSDVIDRAIQVHGAEGISQDTPLAHMWVGNRTLRFADGPDEVHMAQVGKVEIKTRVPYLQDRRERTLKAQAQLLRQHKL